jgi:hypothetical protein
MQTFQRFGVRRLEVLGQNFDPNLHKAVAQIEDSSQPPGTITRVAEEGYMIHNRPPRPARAFVAMQLSRQFWAGSWIRARATRCPFDDQSAAKGELAHVIATRPRIGPMRATMTCRIP